MRVILTGLLIAAAGAAGACSMEPGPQRVSLMTLDPGHFHAALVQKTMYPGVDPQVYVFAPAGNELQEHLKRIDGYNSRAQAPTHWRQTLYTQPDWLDRAFSEKPGNVVVLSGNNLRKTDYILKSVQAGLNVLADKPMVITPSELPRLEEAFKAAKQNRVLLYDIMTERFEINSILQRELAGDAALFGHMATGTEQQPAIVMESVHYFSKVVSGAQLKRPAWFFDVRQQGEAIPDVGTHLVDLVQWIAYPDTALDPSDVTVTRARRWATPITREQFERVTGEANFPAFLQQDVRDGVLQEYANGEMTYKLRDTWVKVIARWDYQAAAGGDTHFASVRGSKATLTIRQGAEQSYKPRLYIEKAPGSPATDPAFEESVKSAVSTLQKKFPGIGYERSGAAWVLTVPATYDVGHEAHFAAVTENFLKYLREGRLPAWEVPNMLTKYATTMKAYTLSHR